jgi:hypothetical protein
MLFESAKRLERIELPAASCGVAELADEICLEDVTADSFIGAQALNSPSRWCGSKERIEMSGHSR